MKKIIIGLFGFLGGALIILALSQKDSVVSLKNSGPDLSKKIEIVTSFSILSDIIKEIGQDKTSVTCIVGPNNDTHMYEPKNSDVKKILKADLIILNGLGFDDRLKKFIMASNYKGSLIIASDGVHPRLVFEETQLLDPHAWHSVKNIKIYVQNIRDALIKLDPRNKDYYNKNYKIYENKLDILENIIQSKLKMIPIHKRKIITAHDAFGYFGNAYGIKFMAPKGINTESEAKVQNVIGLIKHIKDNHIKTIFVENIADPKLIQQIGAEAGAKVGGILYSDALSEFNGPADTYLKMMAYNVSHLFAAMAE